MWRAGWPAGALGSLFLCFHSFDFPALMHMPKCDRTGSNTIKAEISLPHTWPSHLRSVPTQGSSRPCTRVCPNVELEDHPTAQATVGDAQSPGSPVLPSLGHRAPRPLYWAPTLYGLLTASPAQGGALGRGLRAPTCMPPPSELLLTLGPPPTWSPALSLCPRPPQCDTRTPHGSSTPTADCLPLRDSDQ